MHASAPFLIAVLALWRSPYQGRLPPNDTAAQALTLPANVEGTTAEATLDEDEPPGRAFGDASVWYSFSVGEPAADPRGARRAGDMDATVEVFVRALPGHLARLQNTNRRGEATLDIDARADTPYLIRIAPLANSVRDSFRLRVVALDEPARAPGERLPAAGTSARSTASPTATTRGRCA